MSSLPSLQPGHAADSRQSTAGLTINLSSNNPFRNRAASPAASLESPFGNKPASPFDDPPPRPISRNPFLDQVPPPLRSPGVMSTQSDSKSLSAEEIFDSLTLDEKPSGDKQKPPPPRRPMDRPPQRRGENMPPPPNGSHRPTASQEEALRARRMQGAGPRPDASSPQRRPPRRPRRNSESSVMDFDAKSLTEDEKRMIEARRREKARRERDAREGREPRPREGPREGREGRDSNERSKSGRPNRPSRRMDIIDKLDATSIYGTGLFHHDGPFDALNPHRNRQNSSRAPMHAFPKDSLNNSLGGAGPLNKQPDHATFMGMGNDEAFRDFSGQKISAQSSSRKDVAIFDSSGRESIVHGDESHGLGTSTFLEGTPAARSAIVRRQEEQAQETVEGGLQRKKSLAQRIRHVGKGPRENPGRMNGEGAYNRISPEAYATGGSNGSENNPFFTEFSKGEDNINVQPRSGAMSPSSPPAGGRRPSNPLERRATTDAATSLEDGSSAKPMGLLGRMKSLKGGRRPRPDANNVSAAPGTAV